MAKNFDHGRPRLYFTSDFLKNHIYLGSTGEKKKAENVFLRRGRNISTVLCLTRLELVRLAGEVHSRQEEFSRRPNAVFTTQHAYDCWSRGGAQGKDKQRATASTRHFRFAVRMNPEGIYTPCHFHGAA